MDGLYLVGFFCGSEGCILRALRVLFKLKVGCVDYN